MTCNACGEKPKNTAKDFTKAVIEINNPETLVLLRKVVIPASMGTEEDVPAAIGKYHNVILHYEANKHTYLYSSDGIPTLLETEVPQAIIDRIDTLEDNVDELNDAIDDVEQEIEDLKNSPDVVDIVATYADLQAYDTSDLGDKDVVRVLTDETHDNESSYYRWSTSTQTWTFIGATGPYYTKSEVDGLLDEKQGALTAGNKISIDNNTISLVGNSITVLTPDDNNFPVNNPAYVALWLLDDGIYNIAPGTTVFISEYEARNQEQVLFAVNELSGIAMITVLNGSPDEKMATYIVDKTTGTAYESGWVLRNTMVTNSLTSTNTTSPLAAYQGKVLNERIGDLSTLQTTAKTSAVAAINELVGSGSGVATINSQDWSALWQ